MKITLVAVSIFVLSLFCFGVQSQPNISCWVAVNGTDAGCQISNATNPCATIAKCIELRPTNTSLDIIMFPGIYPPAGNCNVTITGVYPLTISATGITNSDPTPAILDCGGNSHMTITPAATESVASSYVHVSSLKFRNGAGSQGGCVHFSEQSNVTLMEIWFTECAFEQCSSSGDGGAIAIASSAMVNLNFCNFTNNEAQRGGAVSNTAFLTPLIIQSCLFVANSATQGGAIYSTDVNKVIDSQFVLNVATEQGGCIYHNLEAGVSEFTRCTAAGNIAQTGGVFFLSNSVSVFGGSINFRNSTITSNEAIFGGVIAIDPTSLQPVQMTGSDNTITKNVAMYGGFLWASADVLGFSSGVMWIGNQIEGNKANLTGGGIYITTAVSQNKNDEIFMPGLILSHNIPDDIFCEGNASSQVEFCKPCGANSCQSCSSFVCVEGLETASAPAMCYSNLPKTCANNCFFESADAGITCLNPSSSSSSEGEKPFTKTAGFVVLMVLIVIGVFVGAAFGVIYVIRKRNTIAYTELK